MVVTKTKKYFIGVIGLVLVFALVVLFYFLVKGEKETPGRSSPETGEGATTFRETPFSVLEEVGAGKEGEVLSKDEETGEEKPLITPEMPRSIFSTTGTILEVKEDALIVKGDGTNFADGLSRNLTGIFTEDTLTFTKNKVKYKGKEGLKELKAGMEVLLGSAENMRGKTEFLVKTVGLIK